VTGDASSAVRAISRAVFSEPRDVVCRRRPPSRRLSPEPICLPKTSISSRLPPPRSPATPVGVLEAGDDAEGRHPRLVGAGQNGDRHAAISPSISAMNDAPFAASRVAAVAST
jgi:hypothetical protein